MFVIKLGVGYLKVQGFGYALVDSPDKATLWPSQSDALHRARNVFGKVERYEPDPSN